MKRLARHFEEIIAHDELVALALSFMRFARCLISVDALGVTVSADIIRAQLNRISGLAQFSIDESHRIYEEGRRWRSL